MSREEVKVLGGSTSPFVFRVELALKLKGVTYEVVDEDLRNKSPLLLQLNPIHKRVPVLIYNGKPISESLVIIEYIDDIWKHNPIFPQHPYDKAMARFWAKFVDDKFTEAMRGILHTSEEEEERQKQVEKAKEALKILEEELKKKEEKFFGGDKIGIVDITLGFLNNWVHAIEEVFCAKVHDPEMFPLIEKWNQNFIEDPCVKQTLPEQYKLVEYFSKSRSIILAQK
ncbi:Glutathione S-transferase family protein [Euphorbia peplus]|nr:Glutathione S-transferase family protein [Euphorbia peplus]